MRVNCISICHYNEVIMIAMSSQITSLTIVYSTVYSGADQRKHQSSMSLAFVRGIHRGPGNSPHKWPVTWKKFPLDDVIMCIFIGMRISFLPKWGIYEICMWFVVLALFRWHNYSPLIRQSIFLHFAGVLICQSEYLMISSMPFKLCWTISVTSACK